MSERRDGIKPWRTFDLATEAEQYLGDDPRLQSLWPQIVQAVSFTSDPLGARVYAKSYIDPESEWLYLGQTPIDSVRLPRAVLVRMKVEKEGFQTVEGIIYPLSWWLMDYQLHETGSLPDDMVFAWNPFGISTQLQGFKVDDDVPEQVRMADNVMDRYEVTNNDYKRFLDDGGYKNPAYWKEPFERDSLTLFFEDAMALFTDKTGRPGPASWEVGDYPEGEDDYPVTGVSWFEAAAYAEFAGKSLPTIYHWNWASFSWAGLDFTVLSNLDGSGPVPVGSSQALHLFGVYDMAGNAREWVWNESSPEGARFILGGGWNDPAHAFGEYTALSPFDRSETNGLSVHPVSRRAGEPGRAFSKART